MQLGMIGLGRMGANLVRRVMRDGHECVVYDPNPGAVKALVAEGATGVDSIPDLVGKLKAPPSVSWLVDLMAASLQQSPDLGDFAGRVSDSGEGRWTAIAAIEEGVPAPVLTAALDSRFTSRHLDGFADQALSAMRKQFGGHDEKPAA